MLEFLQTPDQLGLTAGDQISFTALFAADALVEVAYTTGDVDGDGTPDFIVGANFADPGGVTSAGSAYVYSGADGSLIHQINGTSTGDYLGRSVAMVGDLDGDGFEDFIVGAYNADPGGNSGAGSAYIYSGADASLIRQINGSAAGDSFGYSVGGAGADPGGNLSAGSAYVYSGADGSLIHQVDGQYNGHGIGRAVAGAGDVNGDGFADFILGTYLADPGTTNAGNAYVYSGADGGVLYTKTGGASFRWLGHSVSPAGDVNADGYADFMVGVPLDDPADMTNAGTVRVYSGLNGSLLRQLEGADTGDRFGLAVASAGDANGDGTLDFIVGASAADPGSLSQAGSAYVLSGATGAVIHQVDGAAAGDYLGHAVAGVGDVDQDGKSDFLIGAYGADPGGRTGAGTAYIYSGADESLIHQVDGAATGDNLGSSVGGPANLAAQGEAGSDVEPGK